MFRRKGRKVRRKANAEDAAFFATAVKVCSSFDVEYPQLFFFFFAEPPTRVEPKCGRNTRVLFIRDIYVFILE